MEERDALRQGGTRGEGVEEVPHKCSLGGVTWKVAVLFVAAVIQWVWITRGDVCK